MGSKYNLVLNKKTKNEYTGRFPNNKKAGLITRKTIKPIISHIHSFVDKVVNGH